MTATDPAGNTSEFSQRLPFTINPGLRATRRAARRHDRRNRLRGRRDGDDRRGCPPPSTSSFHNFNQITATPRPRGRIAQRHRRDQHPGHDRHARKGLGRGLPGRARAASSSTRTSPHSCPTRSRPASAAASTASTSRHAAPADGGVPPEGQVRHLLHAAPLHGRSSPTCPALRLRALDQGARGRGHHGRLRRRQLLPARIPVRRDQMAVFLLKAEHGSGLRAAGMHRRLPRRALLFATSPPWIEQLARGEHHRRLRRRQLLPAERQHAGQMAVFIVKTFNLQ